MFRPSIVLDLNPRVRDLQERPQPGPTAHPVSHLRRQSHFQRAILFLSQSVDELLGRGELSNPRQPPSRPEARVIPLQVLIEVTGERRGREGKRLRRRMGDVTLSLSQLFVVH